MKSNRRLVNFSMKIKKMIELLSRHGIRHVAKDDGFYQSIYDNDVDLESEQATLRDDASVILKRSGDAGVEARISADDRKVFMRALYCKDTGFNIVEADMDEPRCTRGEKMSSCKVVATRKEWKATYNELPCLEHPIIVRGSWP